MVRYPIRVALIAAGVLMSFPGPASAGLLGPVVALAPIVQSSSPGPARWFGACLDQAADCDIKVVPLPGLTATRSAWAAFDRPIDDLSAFAIGPVQDLPETTDMAVGGPTLVPYGWFDFCSRHPEECKVKPLPPKTVQSTSANLELLDRVNRSANAAITPVGNLAHWGTTLDHWDYPTDGKGDCKVYALFKRKLLIEAGLPRQALLMTIVRDLAGEGHTVLTVRTDRGDVILDNLTDAIRPWDATGYKYLKRQAETDPNVWLDLRGVRGIKADEVAAR